MNTLNIKFRPATLSKGTITHMTSKRKPVASATELLAAEGVDLPQVMQDLQQLSPINASRVVKLHDRIGAGEYVLDANRIAAKLLDFENSLDP